MDDETGPAASGLHVDARSLRCPLPIIRLAAAAKLAPGGTVVTVLSTDPAAEPDIAAWCRMRGAELLDQEWTADQDGQYLRSEVLVGTPPPPNPP